jgi:hypothetical protein
MLRAATLDEATSRTDAVAVPPNKLNSHTMTLRARPKFADMTASAKRKRTVDEN